MELYKILDINDQMKTRESQYVALKRYNVI